MLASKPVFMNLRAVSCEWNSIAIELWFYLSVDTYIIARYSNYVLCTDKLRRQQRASLR